MSTETGDDDAPPRGDVGIGHGWHGARSIARACPGRSSDLADRRDHGWWSAADRRAGLPARGHVTRARLSRRAGSGHRHALPLRGSGVADLLDAWHAILHRHHLDRERRDPGSGGECLPGAGRHRRRGPALIRLSRPGHLRARGSSWLAGRLRTRPWYAGRGTAVAREAVIARSPLAAHSGKHSHSVDTSWPRWSYPAPARPAGTVYRAAEATWCTIGRRWRWLRSAGS